MNVSAKRPSAADDSTAPKSTLRVIALTAEYSAPSAGRPPWFVYRLTSRTAMALATVEPGGATRWRFE